jgi:hypothetical protein
MADKNNMNKNISDNFITKIWGPSYWFTLHCVSFSYPDEPTEDDKQKFKLYFENLILPCSYCQISYKHFIISEPTILNDNALKNKNSLTKWLYDIHNRVNKKLQVDYGISYEDVVKKYNNFRAVCDPLKEGCIMPLDKKQKCYQTALKKDCPLINLDIANCFRDYANKRNIDFFPERYVEIMKNKDCEEWDNRNKKCLDIIQKIRLSGVPVVEQEGDFVGLPTIDELTLISMLSTTLSKSEIIELTNRLDNKYYTIYKLKI